MGCSFLAAYGGDMRSCRPGQGAQRYRMVSLGMPFWPPRSTVCSSHVRDAEARSGDRFSATYYAFSGERKPLLSAPRKEAV